MRLCAVIIAAALALVPAAALAHPHEWIDAAAEFLFDAQGKLTGIRQHWRFDEQFTAFALQGLDTDGDGFYSADELKPLAQENVDALKEYTYFTTLLDGDDKQAFASPRDYSLELAEGRLTLHYTLPLARPLDPKKEITLQVYDPEYYIDFSFPSREAARMVQAPGDCKLEVWPAEGPTPDAAAALATVGADQRQLPDNMQGMTGGIDNTAVIDCGAALAVVSAERANPHSAADATRLMAEGISGHNIDLKALPPGPANAASSAPAAGPRPNSLAALATPHAAPLPAPAPAMPREAALTAAAAADAAAAARSSDPQPPRRPGASLTGRFMAKLGAVQTAFNRQLTGSLKAFKADGAAFWWLAAISFGYGVVHAAGPGHGKVVISSYLLANEQRLRRGMLIALVSALLQAAVAVGIVGLMALALNMTSMAITSTAQAFESGSYALVAALGLYLLVAKGRQAWSAAHGGDAHAHHHHHHHHHESHGGEGRHSGGLRLPGRTPSDRSGPACACQHHADPAATRPGLSGAATAVLSVGIRPCSGALVVLVFALAQGVFWAGIASTFIMALGTAITVAALASVAVGAKGLARRLARVDDRRSGQVMLGMEFAAAFMITCVGVVLFAGSLHV